MVAATEKEAAAADQIKTLAESTPAAAGSAVAATATAPGAATAAVADTSKKAEKLAEKADEATAAKTDVKVQLVDYSTQLMGERTALTDRLKLVLDKLEAKGGDGKPYRLYIASIGGIKIDVTDRTATLARISGWLSSEEGGLRLARDVGTFLAYIIGSIVVARIVRMILRRVMSGDHVTSHLLRDFIISSSGRVIVAIGFLLALSALEVNLAPLLAVIGAAGFVVAFALQGTLSNFASGLLIMVFKPFDVGDEVEVGGGIKGKVTHVTIFSTYIRTDEGREDRAQRQHLEERHRQSNDRGREGSALRRREAARGERRSGVSGALIACSSAPAACVGPAGAATAGRALRDWIRSRPNGAENARPPARSRPIRVPTAATPQPEPVRSGLVRNVQQGSGAEQQARERPRR